MSAEHRLKNALNNEKKICNFLHFGGRDEFPKLAYVQL